MKARQDNSPVKCRDGVDEMTKVDIERVMGFAASTRIPTDDVDREFRRASSFRSESSVALCCVGYYCLVLVFSRWTVAT